MRHRNLGDSPVLIVGLRNPGPNYEGSRHNVGAEVVEVLAAGSVFKRAPRRILAELVTVDVGGRRAVLAMTISFMNESGGPVSGLVKYYKTAPGDLVLVHDDIDLPFGKVRFHGGRGSGGHNGVSSVIRSLGSREVWRLKIGVGRPPGRMDPADFVLRRFTNAERPDIDLVVPAAAGVLRTYLTAGADAARQEAGDATTRLGIAE
jgi:PTH1 family peptidyl-tRNA hydrolase